MGAMVFYRLKEYGIRVIRSEGDSFRTFLEESVSPMCSILDELRDIVGLALTSA